MLFGILVFVFVVVVGKMTMWRVHSNVCDTHLAVLPSPDDDGNILRHASMLFITESFTSLLFFWRRGSVASSSSSAKRGSNAPVPVVPVPRGVAQLRDWAGSVATTFRLVLFGRRAVVTSSPKLARRILHTHFKLYSKDGVNDPNSQLPPGMRHFVPKAERGLITRPDMKDRTPHGASRTAFAQSLLQTVYDAKGLRARVGVAVERQLPNTKRIELADLQRIIVEVAVASLVGQDSFEQLPAPQREQFVRDILEAAAELQSEAEAPWRAWFVRFAPHWRMLRTRLFTAARALGTRALEQGLAAKSHDGLAPLAAFAKSDVPDMSNVSGAALQRVKDAMVDSLACEVLTAGVKCAGALSLGVAWALHYCALPQNDALAKAIREELQTPPAHPDAPVSEDAPAGAVEALREALRLHPPQAVVTRTALNDDLVSVADIDVPEAKLQHAIAAQMDSSGRNQSFAKRTGCVMLPSSCVVVIDMDTLLKRTDVFGPDAAEFRPRRFVAHRGSAIRGVSDGVAAGGGRQATDMTQWFLTGGFGIGARGCPAAHWALPIGAEVLRAVVGRYSVGHPVGKERNPDVWGLSVSRRKE